MTQQILTETQEEVTRVEQVTPKKVVKTTTKVIPPPVGEEPPQKAYNTKKAIFRTYQVLWYILGVIEVLLAFRLLLKLLGADPALSGFTNFIFSLSNPFAEPFLGIVGLTYSGNSVFEWSTLIAMIFYWIVVWGIIEFFQLVKPVKPEEVEQTVDSA